MSATKSFQSTAFEVQLKAQWGKDFDRDLMDALCHLADAEAFSRQDFGALEPRIESGELTREFWNLESALAQLHVARDAFWIVKDRTGGTRGDSEVFEIIAKHSARLDEWRQFLKQDSPEVAVVAWLADWISQADGSVPTHARLEIMLDSLKAMAPFFIKETTDDEKARLIRSELTKPVRKLIGIRATRQNPNDVKLWKGIYSQEMEAAAKWIYEERLFTRKTIRVDKLMSETSLPLKSGLDSSSSLFVR